MHTFFNIGVYIYMNNDSLVCVVKKSAIAELLDYHTPNKQYSFYI